MVRWLACTLVLVCGLSVVAVPGPAQAQTLVSAPQRSDWDFHAVDLRTAILMLAERAGVRVRVLDSVPASAMDGWYLRNYTYDQVWYALRRAFGLSWVRIDGVTFVGTPIDLAKRFPNEGVIQEKVLPYSGDPGGVEDFAKIVQGALPDNSVAYGDRANDAIVVIGTPEAIAQATAFMTTFNGGPSGGGAFSSSVIKLHWSSSTDLIENVKSALGATFPPDSVVAGTDSNTIVASGTPQFISRVQTLVRNFDQPVPLIRLDVSVIAMSPNIDTSDFGIEWGGVDQAGQVQPGSGQTVTLFTGRAISVNARINALQKTGRAAVLTRAALYARNNRPGKINGLTDYPFAVSIGGVTTTIQIEHFLVGAEINATPTITADGNLLMDLKASYKTLQGFQQPTGYPIITTNESDNSLMLHNDQALVISGFYSDTDTTTLQKVPLLGDLPLIGGLFRNKQTSHIRQQVVFLVTPHFGTGPDVFNQNAAPIGKPSNLNLNLPVFSGSLPPNSQATPKP